MKLNGILLALVATTMLTAATSTIGVVDFRRCINESERGKQEQGQLETLKQQLSDKVEETETELRDIANKARDPDYLDSLSPEAEEQLRLRFQTLNQELQQQQQQFYQIINQQEMSVMVELGKQVEQSASVIAKAKGLDLVVREDVVFFSQPDMDITDAVITEMDKVHGKAKS